MKVCVTVFPNSQLTRCRSNQCIIKVIVPTVDFWMLNVTLDLPRWEQQADEQLEQFISRTTELSQFWCTTLGV